jgi:HEPN domain-containing protein
VEVHETYFNQLRVRVEELKPILLKISRRETVVQERIELEHLQMNPERLTARGPNAREER